MGLRKFRYSLLFPIQPLNAYFLSEKTKAFFKFRQQLAHFRDFRCVPPETLHTFHLAGSLTLRGYEMPL